MFPMSGSVLGPGGNLQQVEEVLESDL